jgi:UDPglucose 6-dehydrogenase
VNIVCIGSGYVGSVTAAAFAILHHQTTVVDTDLHKVSLINSGSSPIYEPGLEGLIRKTTGTLLRATTSYQAVQQAEAVFICVGTPGNEEGNADLTSVKLAAKSIGEWLHPDRFTVIVNKSTVPVGTADLVASIVEEVSGLQRNIHFAVVSNPEFLREGFAVEDVFFPDRIIVGSESGKARAVMRRLYQPIVHRINYRYLSDVLEVKDAAAKPKPVFFETDTKSAELIKYVSNAFLAVKISYINEIARLSEALGVNVLDVAMGMGLDTRIGGKFLQVSSGWSGSCFPKDTKELLETSRKYGQELLIVKAAVESNVRMHLYCVEKIRRRLKSMTGKKIGILGLTFKPDTDDARITQASVIIEHLIKFGAVVSVHDPQGMEKFQMLHPELPVRYCQQAEEVALRADALLLLTHWGEYQSLDWERIYASMRNPYLLDTRNFLSGNALAQLGFIYEGLGTVPDTK